MCVHTCMHTCVYVCVHSCMPTCLCVCIHACMHVLNFFAFNASAGEIVPHWAELDEGLLVGILCCVVSY